MTVEPKIFLFIAIKIKRKYNSEVEGDGNNYWNVMSKNERLKCGEVRFLIRYFKALLTSFFRNRVPTDRLTFFGLQAKSHRWFFVVNKLKNQNWRGKLVMKTLIFPWKVHKLGKIFKDMNKAALEIGIFYCHGQL